MNLLGKRVVITGGATGIGLATAEAMIAKGAQVLICGRRADAVAKALDRLRATGGQAHGVAVDVSTDAGRETLLTAAMEELGGLDVLINNAGVVRGGRLDDLPEASIRAMIETNLIAPMLLTRAALKHMRANKSGVVVNVTSGAAHIGMPFYATYTATKAGLSRFGESMRREVAGDGIHVMTVYPTMTDTPMVETMSASGNVGFLMETAAEAAAALIAGIESEAFEVIRGGEEHAQMRVINRDDPAAFDQSLAAQASALEASAAKHSAL